MDADGKSTVTSLEKARAVRGSRLFKRSKGIRSRRRRQGEIPTMRAAIRNQCIECMGYQPGAIRTCTAPECWLYPWRFGMSPDSAARRGEIVDFQEDR